MQRGRKGLTTEQPWYPCWLPLSSAASGPSAWPGQAPPFPMIREQHFGRDRPGAGNAVSVPWQLLRRDRCPLLASTQGSRICRPDLRTRGREAVCARGCRLGHAHKNEKLESGSVQPGGRSRWSREVLTMNFLVPPKNDDLHVGRGITCCLVTGDKSRSQNTGQ